SVAADDDRLGPARDQTRHVLADDRLAEDDAAQDIADRAVRAPPHFLQMELFDPRFVRGDGRAFDADAGGLDRMRRVDRDLIVGRVAILDREIVVLEIDVQVGMDKLVANQLPDDARHFVAIEFDDRIRDLDLGHLKRNSRWRETRDVRATGPYSIGALAGKGMHDACRTWGLTRAWGNAIALAALVFCLSAPARADAGAESDNA